MFPRTVSCDACGETAIVKSYGPIHYDTVEPGPIVCKPGGRRSN